MAITASISSTFQIVCTPAVPLSSSNITVTNPGRSFRVVECLITGLTTATVEVKKNSNAGNAVVSSTQLLVATCPNLANYPCTVTATLADAKLAATDNIFIKETAGANLKQITLNCIASDAQSLTAANL